MITKYRPQDQEAIYNLLLSLQADLLTTLKDGVTTREAYQHALAFVKDKKPELEKNFVKNIGFGVSRTPEVPS
jgi:nucleosome binding factor SPN SPT16 subunit